MSLLNYIVTDNEVVALTDTQLSSEINNEILGSTIKANFVPSKNILIAVTGCQEIFKEWFCEIAYEQSLETPEEILTKGPQILSDIQNHVGITYSSTSIYNFIKVNGNFQCIIFKSENNWSPEVQKNSLVIKPDYTKELPGKDENEKAYDYIVRITKIQKNLD